MASAESETPDTGVSDAERLRGRPEPPVLPDADSPSPEVKAKLDRVGASIAESYRRTRDHVYTRAPSRPNPEPSSLKYFMCGKS